MNTESSLIEVGSFFAYWLSAIFVAAGCYDLIARYAGDRSWPSLSTIVAVVMFGFVLKWFHCFLRTRRPRR